MIINNLATFIYRKVLNFYKYICIFFITVLFFSSSYAVEIWYPGTFDPFHKSHYEEVSELLKLYPEAVIKILPIESAYYNQTVDGATLPSLFNYEERVEIIKQTFGKHSNVTVSNELRVIDNDVLNVLKNKIRSSSDPSKHLLVGSDTLSKWENMEGFPPLLEETNLVVGEDTAHPHLNSRLKSTFYNNKKISFIKLPSNSVRSVDVNKAIISQSEGLSDFFTDEAVQYFRQDPKLSIEMGSRYLNRLEDYRKSLAKDELRKVLLLSGVRDELVDKLADNKELMKILANNSDTSKFIESLREVKLSSFDSIPLNRLELKSLIEAISPPIWPTKMVQREIQFAKDMRSEYLVGVDRYEMKFGSFAKTKIVKNGSKHELWIMKGTKYEKLVDLMEIDGESPMFHWNSPEMSQELWNNGAVTRDSLNWRIVNRTNNRAGGGFYLSTSSIDSANYGVTPTSFVPAKKIWVAVPETVEWGQSSKNNQILRNAGVSAIRSPVDDLADFKKNTIWINVIDHEVLENAYPTNIDELMKYATNQPVGIDSYPLEYWIEKVDRAKGLPLENVITEGVLGKYISAPESLTDIENAKLLDIINRYREHSITSSHYDKSNKLIEYFSNNPLVGYERLSTSKLVPHRRIPRYRVSSDCISSDLSIFLTP